MPIINVQLLDGRTPAQKTAFVKGVVDVAEKTLGVPEEAIRVILSEVSAEHWNVGSRSMAEIRGGSDDAG